jgi:hypothetical protein
MMETPAPDTAPWIESSTLPSGCALARVSRICQLTQTERAEALAIFRDLLNPTGIVELALAAVEAEGTEE